MQIVKQKRKIDYDRLEYLYNNPAELSIILGYDRLLPVHEEWIRYIWTRPEDNVLQAHRNSWKTTSVLVIGCIWYLLFNPEKTILITRKTIDGASSILEQITRHYLLHLPLLYEELFGKPFILTDYNKTRITLPTKKKITKEGSIEVMGMGGSITGSHYDIIIADDIITLKDRISPAEREATKNYIRELKNVKTIGGKIGYTGTPWHKDDGFSILPAAIKYPVGKIKIPGFTKEVLDDIKRSTTASLFAANYLLEHIADENREFVNPNFAKWIPGRKTTGHVDPAYDGNNTTAFSLIYEEAGRVKVRGWVWRKNVVDLYSRISGLAKENNCQVIYYEKNADKGVGVQEFRKYFPAISLYTEHENKHNKISVTIKSRWKDIDFDYEIQPEYLNQVLDYEAGADIDDAPDSLATIIKLVKPGQSSAPAMVTATGKKFNF